MCLVVAARVWRPGVAPGPLGLVAVPLLLDGWHIFVWATLASRGEATWPANQLVVILSVSLAIVPLVVPLPRRVAAKQARGQIATT